MKWLYRILRLFFVPGCKHVWVKVDRIDNTVKRQDGTLKAFYFTYILCCRGCGEYKKFDSD